MSAPTKVRFLKSLPGANAGNIRCDQLCKTCRTSQCPDLHCDRCRISRAVAEFETQGFQPPVKKLNDLGVSML